MYGPAQPIGGLCHRAVEMRRIMPLADRANEYVEDRWPSAAQPPGLAASRSLGNLLAAYQPCGQPWWCSATAVRRVRHVTWGRPSSTMS